MAVKCDHCELIWVDPLPSEEEVAAFYDGYYDMRVEKEDLARQRLEMYQIEVQWLEQFIQKGTVLDVGCSDGSFLFQFSNKWQKFGYDVEGGALDKANERGIKTFFGNFEPNLFKGKTFELVIMRGVIEHLIDPVGYLEKCTQLLNENGYLFISATPDGSAFTFDMYRDKWRLFTPPEHLFFFDTKNLSVLLDKFGFTKVADAHFYSDTPYSDLKSDHERVISDFIKKENDPESVLEISPPFWGNMMTVLYKKK